MRFRIIYVIFSLGITHAAYYSGYDKMLTLVNQERQAKGKSALCISRKLMSSALNHCQYQAQTLQMTHEVLPLGPRFDAVQFSWGSIAENVAETPTDSVDDVMKAWVKSPEHYQNIIGDDYTHFGSGYVLGSNGKYYWTQHFAKASGTEACDGTSGSTSQPASQQQPQTSSYQQPQQPQQQPQQQQQQSQQQQQQPGQQSQDPQSFPSTDMGTPSQSSEPSDPQQSTNYPALGNGPSYSGQLSPKSPSSGPNNDLSNMNIPTGTGENEGILPKYVCLAGKCYKVTKTDYGEGFIPDGYTPNDQDISKGPVFIW